MPCETFQLSSESWTDALDEANIALGVLSLLACSFVFVGYLRNRSRPKILDPGSMLIMLTFSDAMLAFGTLLEGLRPAHKACETDSSISLCILKASISQFFGLASFLWSAAMAHSSHSQISQLFQLQRHPEHGGDHQLDKQRYKMLLYHCYCWGLPFLSLLVLLATQSAGPASSHLCWLMIDRDDSNDSELSLTAAVLVFVLPLLIVELYNMSVFRWLASTIRQLPSAAGTSALLSRVHRLLAIIVGLKFLFLSTRTLRLFYPDNSSGFVGLLVILGAPLQGLGDYYIHASTSLSSTGSTYSTSSHAGGPSTLDASGAVELRAGYSTVHNPISSGKLPSSTHSGIGLLEDDLDTGSDGGEDERGEYATLEGDSAHSASMSLAVGQNDEDEFDEIQFDEPHHQGRVTGHSEHDPQSRRASDIGLLP